MFPKLVRSSARLRQEIREVARKGREVWKLVPSAQKRTLGGAVGVMVLYSAANSSVPWLIGSVFNEVTTGVARHLPKSVMLRSSMLFLMMIGVCYLVRETANVVRRFLVERACTRIDKNLCVKLVSHLLEVDLSTLSFEQVGAIHGRITRSVEGFVQFLRISFHDFIPAIFTGSIALMFVFSANPRAALVMACVAPISLAITFWQIATQNGIRLGLLRLREAMDGTVVELLSGIDYIRASHTHRQEILRVEGTAEARRSQELRHHFEMSLFGSGKAINEGFFNVTVITVAIYLFINGHITAGEMMALPLLFLQVMAPLSEVHRIIDVGHECSLKVADLLALLKEPIDRSFAPVNVRQPILDGSVPLVVADDLQVEYRTSDRKRKKVLNGVNLRIEAGETIGVAGRSGCGKSTWLKIMMRLIHPSGGDLSLGGVPIESVSREAIGDLIGYVGQNPFVFSGTIADNIAYGCEYATMDQIREAARMACIDKEIMAMEGDFQARVSERGQNLSGGQRQRLALARVFLKNPPILILDEGTSALDNISERRVQRAIHAARTDRTVILVAHRLSTLLDTDRIFVFDEGRVAETGTYDELVRNNGVFTELVLSAASEYAPPIPPPARTEPVAPVEVAPVAEVVSPIFEVVSMPEPVAVG